MARRPVKRSRAPCDVKAGQVYRVSCVGKPAQHVVVIRVVNLSASAGRQPMVHYRLITKSGKKKPLEYGMTHIVCWLRWDCSTWNIPDTWDLIQ